MGDPPAAQIPVSAFATAEAEFTGFSGSADAQATVTDDDNELCPSTITAVAESDGDTFDTEEMDGLKNLAQLDGDGPQEVILYVALTGNSWALIEGVGTYSALATVDFGQAQY